MHEVLLSIGSNIRRKKNIRSCLRELAKLFGKLEVSPIYETEAVGFDGDNFFNLVVCVQTDMSVGDLAADLHAIEDRHGRDRNAPKFCARTLDIDILTYGERVGEFDGIKLPREEILKNAFVLLPLSDIRPEGLYPGTDCSYDSLWQAFSNDTQKIWPADFDF